MLRLALMLATSLLLAGCHCNSDSSSCPAEYAIGDPCKVLGQTCPYPGARCGTTCTCENQIGGFFWNCNITECQCTCPCGKIAYSSCETLQCTKPQDPCPTSEEAQAVCTLIVCVDAGAPDGQKDGRPGDAAGDRPRDVGRDGARDALQDAPAERRIEGPLDLGDGG